MIVWHQPVRATQAASKRGKGSRRATLRPLAVIAKDALDWNETRSQEQQDAAQSKRSTV